MGQITVEVVKLTADFLQKSKVTEDQKLLDSDGTPLTIGKVKAKIRLWLAERGAETPEGTIFSMGRDAGIPHSAGNPQDQLELGKTIIFDIFPQEMGGGYFFDFTRTWCLGYAAPKAQKLYDDVAMVYSRIMDDLKVGGQARGYQDLTCQYFEEAGHKTIRQDSKILSGYVHSLGHGLGLDVHERPTFGRGATSKDILAPGSVVTIEPGLYYPDQGMGCRLEDTVWVRPDGEMEILAEYSHQMVLDMKHWKPEN
jgi:Xaa-Pro aminopeptidase